MKKYYSLVMDKDKAEATINIFGDITSMPYEEFGDVSASSLIKELEEISNAKTINVHISSYGGEVKDGLAIYNALKNHKAKVKTYVDSFACSIASVIFMAGEERIMNNASLLMIHNAWTFAEGNAEELRKQADDLDKITNASINIYLEKINISENQLKKLMDNETWLTPEECLEMGFATKIENATNSKVSQSVKKNLINTILQHQEEINIDDEDIEINEEGGEILKFKCGKCEYVHEGDLPEFFVCPECGASKEEFVEVEETETDDEKKVTEEVEKEVDDEEIETTENETETDADKNGDESTKEPEKDSEEDEEPKKDEVTQKCVAFFNAIGKM